MLRSMTRLLSASAALSTLAAACVGPVEEESVTASAEEVITTASTRQFASNYLKNWPTGVAGQTQWSNVIINNPNATPTNVTLTVFRNDGSTLDSFTKTIPARGVYNSFCEPAWLGLDESDPVNHRSVGWVELTASAPVVAMNQTVVREGGTCSASATMLDGEPFLKQPSTRLFTSSYLKNWPTGDLTKTQWSTVVVNNPNAVPAHVTLRVYRNDGFGLLKDISVTVPAHGAWNSYTNPDWNSVPNTESGRTNGWVEILSDVPVVGTNRITHRDGLASTSPAVAFDDTGLIPASTAQNLHSRLFLKNWTEAESICPSEPFSQWSSIIVNNPNPAPANLTVRVYGPNGENLGSFLETIPALGAWNSYSPTEYPGWANIINTNPGRSIGWVDVSSNRPIFGTTRVSFRDGNTFDATPALFNDEPMAEDGSSTVFSDVYLKNQPTTNGRTLWTDAVVDNPSSGPVTITVKILKTGGSGPVTSFQQTIAPHGMWISNRDLRWTNAPDTDPVNHVTTGWVEINASAPVIATRRLLLREGNTSTSPIVLFDDMPFDGG